MGQKYTEISGSVQDFIEKQKMFFVGTATEESRVNISPKGMDSLRVMHANRVLWLNVTGSGNETAAHIQENRRMTLLFTAFTGNPMIVRLYGTARAIHPLDSEWSELFHLFPDLPGARQIFDLNVDLVHTSCGMSVPRYDYVAEREQLNLWALKKGREGIEDYWKEKNNISLDGKEIRHNFYKHPHISSPSSHEAICTLDDSLISNLIPELHPEAHKGTQGHLLSVCGSSGMGGAASLVAHAALKTGCGLLSACVPKVLQDALPQQRPEVMTLAPEHSLGHFTSKDVEFVLQAASKKNAVLLGCGLGQHPETQKFCKQFYSEFYSQSFSKNIPLLLDADGLNNITANDLKKQSLPLVLTPHPRELSRLTGKSVQEIQNSRIQTAQHYATKWGVVLVLKGASTVIASPESEVFINPTGNAGMATAGSGDVLSGMIGSLMAQGLSPLHASLVGVFLQGRAADCYKATLPPACLMASDLIQKIPHAFLSLKAPNFES